MGLWYFNGTGLSDCTNVLFRVLVVDLLVGTMKEIAGKALGRC